MQPNALCDVHLAPMTERVTLVGEDSVNHRQWSDNFQKCPKPGCPRLFNRNKGYIEIQNKNIVLSPMVPCRDHKEPKAIVAVLVGERVWQCFHEDCLCQSNFRGQKISVGQIVGKPAPDLGSFVVKSIDENYRAVIEVLRAPEVSSHAPLYWEKVEIDDLIPTEAAS